MELVTKYKAACGNHSAVSKAAVTGKGVDRIFTAMANEASKKGLAVPLFADKVRRSSGGAGDSAAAGGEFQGWEG